MRRNHGMALAALALAFGLLGGATTAGAATVSLTSSRDNTIFDEDPNASNGAGVFIHAGVVRRGGERRALLEFDIAAALPAGSIISSVSLTLYVSAIGNPGAVPFGLHTLLASWGEAGSNSGFDQSGQGASAQPGDATWGRRFYDTVSWTTPGGDFTLPASAVTDVSGIGHFTWASTPQLVADVQGWLANPLTNFGWLLMDETHSAASARRFGSHENLIPAERPLLEITFTTPVPEPATSALLLAGLGLLGWAARRRRRIGGTA